VTVTDGPYCPRCLTHRITTHGQLCPICIDDDKRRTNGGTR